MQDLREDLAETIETSLNALKEINNEEIRLSCQDVVKRTLNAIIKRIDEELLEMEKQQIMDGSDDGVRFDFDKQETQDFKVWDELFGILAWKFKPTKSGDMILDAEKVFEELKDKFELKKK